MTLPTRQRRKRLIAALIFSCLSIFGGLAWLGWRSNEPSPTIHGHALSVWLTRAAARREQQFSEQAREAVRQAGTNAVPVLLQFLEARSPRWKYRLVRLLEKQRLVQPQFTLGTDLNRVGMMGFQELGAQGSGAVPELIRIYDRNLTACLRDGDTWFTAVAWSLGSIGPPAEAAVPSLLRGLGNTNLNPAGVQIRMDSCLALGRIRARPELVVPALVEALHDRSPFPSVRYTAAEALGRFGNEAAEALPALRTVEQDQGESEGVRHMAAQAVLEIQGKP